MEINNKVLATPMMGRLAKDRHSYVLFRFNDEESMMTVIRVFEKEKINHSVDYAFKSLTVKAGSIIG